MIKRNLSSREFCKHVAIHSGRTMKALKHTRGVTSKQLANELGITPQQLVKYESGDNRISLGALILACNLFQYEVGDFMEDVYKSLNLPFVIDTTSTPRLYNINKLTRKQLSIVNKFINDITINSIVQ